MYTYVCTSPGPALWVRVVIYNLLYFNFCVFACNIVSVLLCMRMFTFMYSEALLRSLHWVCFQVLFIVFMVCMLVHVDHRPVGARNLGPGSIYGATSGLDS